MTEARVFKYRTNLARKMSSPGGVGVDEALARAEDGLAERREAALQTLDERLGRLEALCADRQMQDAARVYDHAAALLGMAGFFETGPFYTAVFSLCELADRLDQARMWDRPSVIVHIQALRGILTEDCRSTEQTDRLLEGLVAILDRAPRAPV